MDWEEAKQKIAENYGCANFKDLCLNIDSRTDGFPFSRNHVYIEADELYQQSNLERIKQLEKELFSANDRNEHHVDRIKELEDALKQMDLQLNMDGNCTHENTIFQNIRCNVCSDCGHVIEIDV